MLFSPENFQSFLIARLLPEEVWESLNQGLSNVNKNGVIFVDGQP
jgi:hypothetical protein